YNHLAGEGREGGWGKRNVLNLAISDDGLEWRAAGIIEREPSGEFSYPAMIQTADGLVHMTYTWNRRKVKHVIVDPVQLQAGPVVGLGPWGDE
ncbi:MAG: exo-alpha-sialidase, partial [Pirellulales bacterium]